jgi:hypothetical protein
MEEEEDSGVALVDEVVEMEEEEDLVEDHHHPEDFIMARQVGLGGNNFTDSLYSVMDCQRAASVITVT